jgi:hypothetical protein
MKRRYKSIKNLLAPPSFNPKAWSLEANLKIGLTALRNPVIIPNMVNPTIFYPPPTKRRVILLNVLPVALPGERKRNNV